MKKIQKLQVTLNEVARMQQLAGIIPLVETNISEIAVSKKGVKLFHKDIDSVIESLIKYAEKRNYDINKSEIYAKGNSIRIRPSAYAKRFVNLKKNGKIQPEYLIFTVYVTEPSALNPKSQLKIDFDIRRPTNPEKSTLPSYDSYRKDDLTPEELAIQKQKNKELDDLYYGVKTNTPDTKNKKSILSRIFGKK